MSKAAEMSQSNEMTELPSSIALKISFWTFILKAVSVLWFTLYADCRGSSKLLSMIS